MCDATTEFWVLDLSHNNLSGTIPSCLLSKPRLQILNLKGNNFQGNISSFPDSCNLRTLDLSGNNLEGHLPRSIVACQGLEVFDVANNQLTGNFPSWLRSMPRLRVLVLRSNNFSGAWGSQGTECNFTMLQIFDISSNNFSGTLPKECFSSWNAMMVNTKEKEWNQQDQIIGFSPQLRGMYYQQTVTVTVKGIVTELVKILTIFTIIDLSNNNFEGEIPVSIGNLTSLYGLNFSSNALTGTIPSTFGNLKHLESLDLSRNKMTGEIPFQLAGLSSLSVLNVSFNKLTGKIPSGGQFQTFQSSSFQGNVGLCGFPLSKDCNTTTESPPNGLHSVEEKAKNEFDWVLFAVTFLGFVVGACMVIGPQYFWKKGRQWANEHINKLLNIG
ncbi:hypothetical protein MKW92_052145 [Papaver armeniacum]|nr:hypothetical protein MKW92_052145 [Papaver armeniacum]